MGLMPTLPRSGPLTLEDFEAIRDVDDGHRYELIDGSLVVTPSPVPLHQTVVTELLFSLRTTAPPGMRVFVAPLDVRFGMDTVLQPDLLVAARGDLTDQELPSAPLLAVEVLSPSTRRIDELLKRDRFAAAGVPSYWLVDPAGPSVTVLELGDGAYREAQVARGEEWVRVTAPFPLEFRPVDLLQE